MVKMLSMPAVYDQMSTLKLQNRYTVLKNDEKFSLISGSEISGVLL